jgi:hypothetical protein
VPHAKRGMEDQGLTRFGSRRMRLSSFGYESRSRRPRCEFLLRVHLCARSTRWASATAIWPLHRYREPPGPFPSRFREYFGFNGPLLAKPVLPRFGWLRLSMIVSKPSIVNVSRSL